MSQEKERPIMSRSVLNSGSDNVPSIQGYLNREEFMKGFRNSGKWAVAIAAVTAASIETIHYLLVNLGKIYTGPGAATFAALAGAAALVVRLKYNADRDFEQSEDKPILFSDEDETDG
jgi:hypothetical protein